MPQYPAEIQDEFPARTSADQETLTQFRTFRDTREVALRDLLVSKHLHLVHSVARRFSGVGESIDDLVQEGSIGLLNAVDLFDPSRGVKFSTYACHLITSQIQHYLRDRGRLIRQPAWVQELNTKVSRTTERLTQELGRDPLPTEVAERLSISEDAVQNVIAVRELNRVVSLNAPTDNSGDNDQSLLERGTTRSKTTAMQLPVEDRIVLEEAVKSLKPLEQQVIRFFFFGDLNQTEIARKLGISVNYASYLLRRALSKVRARLDEQRLQETTTLLESEAPPPQAPSDITTYDPLTGVYSGPYLHLRVAEEIARSRRYPTNFALMLARVQGLPGKDVDQQAILAGIGQLFRVSTRIVDLTAHMGNGLFALLLPHTGREARVLGERLCTQIITRELLPPGCANSLGLNIGFAVFPADGTNGETLFQRAESALAKAVRSGPNTVMNVTRSFVPFPNA